MHQAANDPQVSASEPSPLQSRRLLIGMLVAAVVLFHLLAAAAHKFAGMEGPPGPTALLLFGFALADASLAGLYLGLGRGSATSRFFVALAVALGGGVTGGYAVGFHDYDDDFAGLRLWCGIALFQTLLTAVPVVYLLARGLRVIHPDDPPPIPSTGRPKFTLWGMMSFTTCAAILLAIARLATFPTVDIGEVLLVGGMCACIAYMAAAKILSDRPLSYSLAWIGGAAIVAAAVDDLWHPFDRWESTMFLLSQASLLTGVLFVLRTAGYRLRWPEYVVPSESPFATATAAPQRDAAAEPATPNQP